MAVTTTNPGRPPDAQKRLIPFKNPPTPTPPPSHTSLTPPKTEANSNNSSSPGKEAVNARYPRSNDHPPSESLLSQAATPAPSQAASFPPTPTHSPPSHTSLTPPTDHTEANSNSSSPGKEAVNARYPRSVDHPPSESLLSQAAPTATSPMCSRSLCADTYRSDSSRSGSERSHLPLSQAASFPPTPTPASSSHTSIPTHHAEVNSNSSNPGKEAVNARYPRSVDHPPSESLLSQAAPTATSPMCSRPLYTDTYRSDSSRSGSERSHLPFSQATSFPPTPTPAPPLTYVLNTTHRPHRSQ